MGDENLSDIFNSQLCNSSLEDLDLWEFIFKNKIKTNNSNKIIYQFKKRKEKVYLNVKLQKM